MIGSELESHSKTPFVAALMLALAIGCALVSILLRSRDWIVAGMLPLAISTVLFLARERRFIAKLTEHGIVVMPEELVIPYDSIRAIWPVSHAERLRSNGRMYGFNIQYGNQVLSVPAELNVASGDVVEFLAARIPQIQPIPANSAVADYMRNQVSTFGSDHVWSYGARSGAIRRPQRAYRNCLVMLAAAVVGLIWLILGAVWHLDAWIALGVITMLVSILGAALFFIAAKGSAPRIKNWQNSSLVISPLGFALSQGDLCGELRWKEIRDVRLQGSSRAVFSDVSDRGRGIIIRVEGANILVADLYDAPIEVIHDRITQLWRHGE